MTNKIAFKRLYQVNEWNNLARSRGQYILIYTKDNGSMVDEPRQRGYVVQKRHIEGGERSKFHMSKDRALQDFNSDKF